MPSANLDKSERRTIINVKHFLLTCIKCDVQIGPCDRNSLYFKVTGVWIKLTIITYQEFMTKDNPYYGLCTLEGYIKYTREMSILYQVVK